MQCFLFLAGEEINEKRKLGTEGLQGKTAVNTGSSVFLI